MAVCELAFVCMHACTQDAIRARTHARVFLRMHQRTHGYGVDASSQTVRVGESVCLSVCLRQANARKCLVVVAAERGREQLKESTHTSNG